MVIKLGLALEAIAGAGLYLCRYDYRLYNKNI